MDEKLSGKSEWRLSIFKKWIIKCKNCYTQTISCSHFYYFFVPLIFVWVCVFFLSHLSLWFCLTKGNKTFFIAFLMPSISFHHFWYFLHSEAEWFKMAIMTNFSGVLCVWVICEYARARAFMKKHIMQDQINVIFFLINLLWWNTKFPNILLLK